VVGVTWKTARNPYYPDKWGQSQAIFSRGEALYLFICINISMTDKYVYQIQGALENAAGEFKGLRILVCDLYNFDSVDVPVDILDNETAKYIQFRLNCTKEIMNIAKLPFKIQDNIRGPLGPWLDHWVRENFHGDFSNRKSLNL